MIFEPRHPASTPCPDRSTVLPASSLHGVHCCAITPAQTELTARQFRILQRMLGMPPEE